MAAQNAPCVSLLLRPQRSDSAHQQHPQRCIYSRYFFLPPGKSLTQAAPPAMPIISQSETKNPRINQLSARWQQVWLLALERQRKLNDALDRLEEVTGAAWGGRCHLLSCPGPAGCPCCFPHNAKRKKALLKRYGLKLPSLINCSLMNCFAPLQLVSVEVMTASPALFLVISLTN